MIVADRQADRDGLVEATEVLADALPDRLQRLKPGARERRLSGQFPFHFRFGGAPADLFGLNRGTIPDQSGRDQECVGVVGAERATAGTGEQVASAGWPGKGGQEVAVGQPFRSCPIIMAGHSARGVSSTSRTTGSISGPKGTRSGVIRTSSGLAGLSGPSAPQGPGLGQHPQSLRFVASLYGWVVVAWIAALLSRIVRDQSIGIRRDDLAP